MKATRKYVVLGLVAMVAVAAVMLLCSPTSAFADDPAQLSGLKVESIKSAQPVAAQANIVTGLVKASKNPTDPEDFTTHNETFGPVPAPPGGGSAHYETPTVAVPDPLPSGNVTVTKEPTPTPNPTPDPTPTVPPRHRLPFTGGDYLSFVLVGLGLAVIGGSVLLIGSKKNAVR